MSSTIQERYSNRGVSSTNVMQGRYAKAKADKNKPNNELFLLNHLIS